MAGNPSGPALLLAFRMPAESVPVIQDIGMVVWFSSNLPFWTMFSPGLTSAKPHNERMRHERIKRCFFMVLSNCWFGFFKGLKGPMGPMETRGWSGMG